MKPQYPLELHHSWPLVDRALHFELGHVHGAGDRHAAAIPAAPPANDVLPGDAAGAWQCDLRDDSLTWSPEVYDIFGLPRGAAVSRGEAVALYAEGSRAAMERLRAHAIAHRRGFTIDVQIRPADGGYRWVRLIAAPVCDGDEVVGLHGYKWLIPADGRRGNSGTVSASGDSG